MAIDAEKLDQEADAEYARLMGQEAQAPAAQTPQDKQSEPNPPADDVPPPPAPEPEALNEPPAPGNESDNWQDKYTKAEESRKNAHALMTQATQKAADLERSNSELQHQMATLQAQVNLLSQQAAPQSASQTPGDQFQELRQDYQELNPVFNELDASRQQNQALEQRLAAIEQARRAQDSQQAQQAFWATVKQEHPDIEQLAASPDFQGWFSRQTADVQELSVVSPKGAAYVMTLYKQSAGLHAPQNKMQQAQQLSEPQVRGNSRPQTQGGQPALTPDQIAALPQKEYEANEDKYDEMLSRWMKQGGRL